MYKWRVLVAVILAAVTISGCSEKSEPRRILTPTESDLQEFVHEVEVVDSDVTRLRGDVERVRKILLEMEQSLDRVSNSTREIQKTIARLQGRPIEDPAAEPGALGRTISWIIALLLLLVVIPIFVLKYLQTRQESVTWSDGMRSSDPSARSTDSELVDPEFSSQEEPDPQDASRNLSPDEKEHATDASPRPAPESSADPEKDDEKA